ncbi:MAG: ferritin [Clostridiaceae bacterium]|nr:ferritin [Clostridiaceae bacterium]HZW97603.1 ferritin [Bacillota bacterium]
MRMKEEVRQAFSTQINREYYSAFLYLQMSDWLNQNNWPGSAHWMYVQYKEELAHAQGLFEYLQYRGVEVNIDTISKPEQQEWVNVLSVFEGALAHEQQITAWINEVVDVAADAGDKAAVLFLDWYVIEQVEEEANQEDNIDNIKGCDGMVGPLRMWDRRMGTREFSPDDIPMPG